MGWSCFKIITKTNCGYTKVEMNDLKQGKRIFISDNKCHMPDFLFAGKNLILLGENTKREMNKRNGMHVAGSG